MSIGSCFISICVAQHTHMESLLQRLIASLSLCNNCKQEITHHMIILITKRYWSWWFGHTEPTLRFHAIDFEVYIISQLTEIGICYSQHPGIQLFSLPTVSLLLPTACILVPVIQCFGCVLCLRMIAIILYQSSNSQFFWWSMHYYFSVSWYVACAPRRMPFPQW